MEVFAESQDEVCVNSRLMMDEHVANLIAGCCAGVISRTFTAPFDRLRTLQQAGLGFPLRMPGDSKASEGRYSAFRPFQGQGLLRAAEYVVAEGGYRGFFRGNFINCVKIAPEYALKFTINPIIVDILCEGNKQEATLVQRFAAGCLSGVLITTAMYPLEIVKARITVAARGEYRSAWDCVRRTATEGIPGESVLRRFYKGYSVSLLGSLPYNGTQLSLNSYMRDFYTEQYGHVDGGASVGISLLCSLAAISVAYPFNLARTKLQTQGVNNRTVLYNGFRDVVNKTLLHEGTVGLYRGFLPNAMKALPAQVIALEVVARVSGFLTT